MHISAHERERAALREALEGPGPTFALIRGRAGVGKTRLLTDVLEASVAAVGERVLRYRASVLPDGAHRRLVADRVARWLEASAAAVPTLPEPLDPSWADLFGRLAEEVAVTRRPCVLAFDDAQRMIGSRGNRFLDALGGLWTRVRAHALPVHVVLSGDGTAMREGLAGTDPPLLDAITLDLPLAPLSFRGLTDMLDRWPPLDRLRAWTVFGGLPGRIVDLDPARSLAENVRRLLLDRDAPLRTTGEAELVTEMQSPARYASILHALAAGAREWGEIVEASADFEGGGTMAPYLARLEAGGWIRTERSLDAPPRARSRRYRIEDPFTAFWFRLILPFLTEIEAGEGDVWARHVRPGLDAHAARLFPALCRQWLRDHAEERLPAVAREVGGLWGSGYDLPVSGTLRSGAVFYGVASWGGPDPGDAVVGEIERAMRETRYGFGRESRYRLVFTTGAPAPDLVRRAARDPRVVTLTPSDLLGSG